MPRRKAGSRFELNVLRRLVEQPVCRSPLNRIGVYLKRWNVRVFWQTTRQLAGWTKAVAAIENNRKEKLSEGRLNLV